ncbi:K02A2.6-like [Cordylochernes scorpioides]|uniref:K02A2.6-like n=1 Tax=Cordylochernes scorpioides TaxID=51811 RepID=A0ABY6K5M2_9ARAC|nr:K02A2.6-like [Cordylochernes scorpioides]
MPPATISEWTWPEKPWHRLHLDLADNGRQFVSGEFEQFTKMNGIRHTKISPYNPSTNGLAERYVTITRIINLNTFSVYSTGVITLLVGCYEIEISPPLMMALDRNNGVKEPFTQPYNIKCRLYNIIIIMGREKSNHTSPPGPLEYLTKFWSNSTSILDDTDL